MDEFTDQDLTGARFEGVTLRETSFGETTFEGARFRRVRLDHTEFRAATFHGARLLGVELVDVVISGDVSNVVVNGVDIAPLVEAELNRRDPERAAMRPTDADGFRTAWDIVRRRWDDTVARARTLPDEMLHASVDGEWSFIETLRHLGFASAAWVERMVLGEPSPWHPFDLPWDEAPGWDGIPWDRSLRPSLDEVLAVRRRRQDVVSEVMATLDDERLAATVTRTEPGWPRAEGFPVSECLSIVLIEEWEHRGFAERDLGALGAPGA